MTILRRGRGARLHGDPTGPEVNSWLRGGLVEPDPPPADPEPDPVLDLGQGVRTLADPPPPNMNDVLRGDQ